MRTTLSLLLLGLSVVASVACDPGSEDSGGCDDPLPALCVSTSGLEGDPLSSALIEVWGDDTRDLVETLTCSQQGACCSTSLATGDYLVTGTYGEEVLEAEVSVENSFACEHEPTAVDFVFDVAR